MEQRALGKTGLQVSVLGFGCGNVGGLMVRGTPEEQRAAVSRAIEAGVTYFDTAAMYGNGLSEQHLGRTLTELGAWGRVRVGTKVRLAPEDLRDPAEAVRESLVASLRRLGRDSVDLLQLHNPLRLASDGQGGVGRERLDAVADALQAVAREGLCGHVGFTGLGDTEAVREAAAGGRFETMQAYFNAINPSAGYAGRSGRAQDLGGVIDVAAEAGLGVIAIRVMAGGAMTGQEQRARLASPSVGPALVQGNAYEVDIAEAAGRQALARELGLESALELSFRFVIAKDGVSTALIGFSDIDQLEQALRWAERGPLSRDQVLRVLEAAAAPA
ncbi:MAG TPA: aldo/keto reductase [Dehalococcoidia bacterium]|nr:aldo/keto reductase [Dehalococcoidia bacterium]